MTGIYALLGSAVLLLVFAALLWTGTFEFGSDPMPLIMLIVVAAVMDVVVAVIFLRKLSR